MDAILAKREKTTRKMKKTHKTTGNTHIVSSAEGSQDKLTGKKRSLSESDSDGLKGGSGGKWSAEEDEKLRQAVQLVGPKNWKRIAEDFLDSKRSDVQCLHRWQKVLRPGLVKGPWTREEDDTIVQCIESGITKWSEIAAQIPGRIGKQCRERWFNHLDPSVKKGGWTDEEDRLLIEAQARLGNRWCEIAKCLNGRTENSVKNRWNSAMRKKWQQRLMEEGKLPNVSSPSPKTTSSEQQQDSPSFSDHSDSAATTSERRSSLSMDSPMTRSLALAVPHIFHATATPVTPSVVTEGTRRPPLPETERGSSNSSVERPASNSSHLSLLSQSTTPLAVKAHETIHLHESMLKNLFNTSPLHMTVKVLSGVDETGARILQFEDGTTKVSSSFVDQEIARQELFASLSLPNADRTVPPSMWGI